MLHQIPPKSPILRYGVSLMLTGATLLVTFLLWPVMDNAPFMFAFGAVALSSWYGGLGPGFLCGLLTITGLDVFLIAPRFQVFANISDILTFIIFTLVALLISTLSDRSIRAQDSLREQAEELENALIKRTELTNKIVQDRQEYEMIINTLPGVVYEAVGSFDLSQQHFTFISDFSNEMLGYDPEEWKGKNFWQAIIHPEDWEKAVKKTRLTFEHGWIEPVSFRGYTKSRQMRYLEAYNRLISKGDPESVRTCGVIMDVTERKNSELALARFAQQLNRSNQELEQFAYIASHDLQEPLRMVISYLQLLERRYKGALDDDAREFISFAVDGANRMKSLISDLLAYSRIQRNREEFEPVDLNDVVEKALSNLTLKIQETDAKITADDLPQILGSRTQLESLLQNLIDNALKYRKEGRPVIHITLDRSPTHWLISVQDNGIGIESQYHSRIFSIFQRLHTRDEYPGTGIGLAICSKIVEKHGGELGVESTPGEGSRFYFSIPIRFKPENRKATSGRIAESKG